MGFWKSVKKYVSVQANIKTNTAIHKKISKIQAAVEPDRPNTGDLYYSASGYRMHKIFPWEMSYLKEIANYSDMIVGMHRALRTEAFRNGIEVAQAKSTDSDTQTSEEKVEVDKKKLNSDIFFIEKYFEKVNRNGQSIIDVLKSLEDDMNTYDNQYMFFKIAYLLNDKTGEIEKQKLREILRWSPMSIEKVQNDKDEPARDDNGNILLSYISNRTEKIVVNPRDMINVIFKEGDEDKDEEDKYFHPETGERLYEIFYKSTDDKALYYFEWELVYNNRYHPSVREGFSPLMSAWLKINTISQQDCYVNELYTGKRPPKSMIVFNTANSESIGKAWKAMVDRVRQNVHLPAIMNVPPSARGNGQGGKFVEYIDFMKNFDELQYSELRNEYRNAVGFMYGISPFLSNDTSSGGGLNDEGMQYTVTNRAVEDNQSGYNQKFLIRILQVMGMSGITAFLRPTEEQDKAALLDRKTKSLGIGRQAAELGLDAEWDEELEDVKIKSGKIVKPEIPDQFGGFGQSNSSNDPSPDLNPEISGTPNKSIVKYDSSSKPVKTITKAAISVTPKSTEMENAVKDIIEKFFKKHKRNPSEKELKEALKSINTKITAQIKTASLPLLTKTYKDVINQVEAQMKTTIGFGGIDKEAIKVLSNSEALTQAYKDLSEETTEDINELIKDAFETPGGLNPDQMTNRIQEISGVSESRARTIARTETGKVSSAARRNSYQKIDPEDKLKYFHRGPDDINTTKTSKRIKKRTQNGVPWDEYVKIIEEESAKEFPEWTVDKNAPLSHYSGRHSFIAK